MKEIEVWEHVLKWGLAQNSTLIPDPDTWSDDDFKSMENTLQHCLPLIRFFSLSSKDFLQNVRPYKKLLKRQLYENLLNSHLDPDSEPTDNIPLPRNIKTDKIIDSKIVNLSIVSLISRWIDKTVIINNSKFAHIRELHLPYKFELLLRGSRDDGKPNTVSFIKVKGTDEILGGYNPLKWKSGGGWVENKDSFIFSFKNNNIEDAIISNIQNTYRAMNNWKIQCPYFGKDIIIYASIETIDYDTVCCKKNYYKKRIRDTEDRFSIEDYEIFQIIRR